MTGKHIATLQRDSIHSVTTISTLPGCVTVTAAVARHIAAAPIQYCTCMQEWKHPSWDNAVTKLHEIHPSTPQHTHRERERETLLELCVVRFPSACCPWWTTQSFSSPSSLLCLQPVLQPALGQLQHKQGRYVEGQPGSTNLGPHYSLHSALENTLNEESCL